MSLATRRETATRKARQRHRWRKPPLYIKHILAWADEHLAETGRWPMKDSGRVRGDHDERWSSIDMALRAGARGLPGGDSLARVLARYRGVRNRKALPPYSLKQILNWADAHRGRRGQWPMKTSGPIDAASGETWMAVEVALRNGQRGLNGGSSLSQLLAARRNVRNKSDLPDFTVSHILAWADAEHERSGLWPTLLSGPIADASHETWLAVDKALRNGTRGLRGGSSLARLLHQRRGVALKHRRQRPLDVQNILSWADAHHQRKGRWPDVNAGDIPEAPGETWGKVQHALHQGKRGLKRSSLAKLLAEHRGVRNLHDLNDYTLKQILAWADAFQARHGRWPIRSDGPIEDSQGETWNAVALAISRGTRGLRGGSSLPKLLAERRGARNRGDLPKFSPARILAWADEHHRRTGIWPSDGTGTVAEAPSETWAIIDRALRNGLRGLRGGSSLARLLKQKRGVKPMHRRLPPLSIEGILAWADAHYRRSGQWPKQSSGKLPEAPGESWLKIDNALRHGKRGLPGGLALGKLWAKYRGVRNRHSVPRLTERQILAWADAWRQRHGDWPIVRSGDIPEAPGDNWVNMDNALRMGLRGLPGGSSLKRLIENRRR